MTTSPGPLLVDFAATELSDMDRELIADPGVGGIILFTRNYDNPEQLCALTADIRAIRPGLLIVADYEGGRVQRFRDGFTRLPPMRALGRLYAQDGAAAREAAGELAWLMASELAACGIDMPLAPVLDLDYGASTVIGSRAFGAQAECVSELGGLFAAALASAGSPATAKHFPGHGHVAADSHAELPTDDRSLAALKADMAVYPPLIDNGLASVMIAHVRYPAVDELPASLSPVWIQDILRAELGFDGCVFCDDLSMGGAAALGDYARRTRLALAAGCDYLPVCNDRHAALAALAALEDAADYGAPRRQRLLQAVGHRHTPPLDRERLRREPRWQAAVATAERLCAEAASAS